MTPKENRKKRKKMYEDTLKKYPQHADDAKRFIFKADKQKDNFAFFPKVSAFKEDLKKVAEYSSYLFDEEMEDLRLLLISELGRKNFNKLSKVFTK